MELSVSKNGVTPEIDEVGMKEQIFTEIEKYGAKAKGRSELLKHLSGKRLRSPYPFAKV